MPDALHELSGTSTTAFAKEFQQVSTRSECNAPMEPARDSDPHGHENHTEMAHANRVAILGQL